MVPFDRLSIDSHVTPQPADSVLRMPPHALLYPGYSSEPGENVPLLHVIFKSPSPIIIPGFLTCPLSSAPLHGRSEQAPWLPCWILVLPRRGPWSPGWPCCRPAPLDACDCLPWHRCGLPLLLSFRPRHQAPIVHVGTVVMVQMFVQIIMPLVCSAQVSGWLPGIGHNGHVRPTPRKLPHGAKCPSLWPRAVWWPNLVLGLYLGKFATHLN